jgi:hypothetical protein
MPNAPVTLLSPTYEGDLPQFAFLRESLERCCVDLPHVAVVHEEDLPRFRELPHQKNLTLIGTRQVLGRKMERRRRSRPHRPRHPMYWVGPGPLHGWMSQQLIKLAAPRVIDTPAYVCIDSDTVCLRHFTADDFHEPDGRLHLYETQQDMDAETAGWTYEAMRFLRLNVQRVQLRKFTHVPTPMRVETVLGLHKRIEQVRGGRWMQAIDHHHITECAAYGAWARFGTDMHGLASAPAPMSWYFLWGDEVAALEQTFAAGAANPSRKFLILQSKRSDRVATLHRAVRQFWQASAAAGPAESPGAQAAAHDGEEPAALG